MHMGGRRIGFAALITSLACALTLTVAGCGGKEPTAHQTIERYGQELRDEVVTHVPDGERRARMLMIVDELAALQLRFSQQTADFVASYRKLNAEYDTPQATFDQLFSDYGTKRIKARNEVLDLHFELASLATAGEWEAIGKKEMELYEEASEARPGAASGK